MSQNPYARTLPADALQEGAFAEERAAFLRKTYLHLAGAIMVFAIVESFLVRSPLADMMLRVVSGGGYNWLMILGVFMGITWFARSLASKVSVPSQYAGLGLMILAYAIIFIPMITMATLYSSATVLPKAGIATLALFTGLTYIAFTSGKDFSFLGGAIKLGMFAAIGLIVAGVIFGFDLGLWFSVAMVVLAGGAILFDTSKILRTYPTGAHVAASVELFASVALMFWYILQIFMSRD